MARYHITENGPKICVAKTSESCTIRGEHFDRFAEAQHVFEEKLHDNLGSVAHAGITRKHNVNKSSAFAVVTSEQIKTFLSKLSFDVNKFNAGQPRVVRKVADLETSPELAVNTCAPVTEVVGNALSEIADAGAPFGNVRAISLEFAGDEELYHNAVVITDDDGNDYVVDYTAKQWGASVDKLPLVLKKDEWVQWTIEASKRPIKAVAEF